jgi:hypothetical protein
VVRTNWNNLSTDEINAIEGLFMLSRKPVVFEPAIPAAITVDDATQLYKDALLIWRLTEKQLHSPPPSPSNIEGALRYDTHLVAGKKRTAASLEDKGVFPVEEKDDDHLPWTVEYEPGHLGDLGLIVGEDKTDCPEEEGKVCRPGKFLNNGFPNINYAMYTIIACSPKKKMRLPVLIDMVYEWFPVLKEHHTKRTQPKALFRHSLCVCNAFIPVNDNVKDGWHRIADVGEKEPKLYGKAKLAPKAKSGIVKSKLTEKELDILEELEEEE